MSLSLAIACETPADQRTGCDLADRVVCEAIGWIEPEHLDHLRGWRGLSTSEPCLFWRDVKR